ncbi:hypothetical protein DH2020_044599 [Rehmannia glutinosa]|uniref:Sulfotransferase n=1 Tax=Rehmannia glutinosa TaxID=99300 RepID=A0ABR0UGG5_REHGL
MTNFTSTTLKDEGNESAGLGALTTCLGYHTNWDPSHVKLSKPPLLSKKWKEKHIQSRVKEKLVNELPKTPFWEARDVYQWEGFWIPSTVIKSAITFRSSFHARNDDIFLASSMKTGTTWLKSLTLCIMQKESHQTHENSHKHDDILIIENPHFHIPTVEATIHSTKDSQIDLYDASTPRLLHTHMPYAVLPDSVKNSACKIVYIARNPKDTLISMWHFFNSVSRPNQDPYPLEKAVDYFCSGIHLYGPFFEHVVEYWQESQKRPEKILFIKYEELKSEPKRQVSRLLSS